MLKERLRPRLHTVSVTDEPPTIHVEVDLEFAGEQTRASASGPPTTLGSARAAAQATLGALERGMEGLRLRVDDVVIHHTTSQHWITVVITANSSSGAEQLVGAALIDGAEPAAAVHATLQACNRRLGSLVDEASRSVPHRRGVRHTAGPPERPQETELAGIVAHQLRGPATSLYGYLQVMRTHFDTLDDQSKSSMLDRSLAGCRRLLARLENLLALAGRDHPVPAATPKRVQVHSAARQALADVPASTDEVEVRCPLQLHVWVDPDHLVQILGNYIENALRHGQPPVVIDATSVDSDVEIAVTDAGPGMDEQTMAQLFRPPEGRRPSATAGTGLGLYIVSLFAQANGGSAHVRRAAPRGTRASIRLPAA